MPTLIFSRLGACPPCFPRAGAHGVYVRVCVLLTDVPGVFALSTSYAAEINSVLTDMLSANDRLADFVTDNTGQLYIPA